MEAEDTVVQRLLIELKSYVPIILATLLIYVVESDSSLKVWHAVRQLPHLEKEPATGDCESNVDETHLETVRATRAAIKKEARKSRIEQLVLIVVLLTIFLFDQFVTLNGWLNLSREGDEFDGYVGNGADDDFDGQSEYGYGWYYLTKFGQIDWAELYYPVLLFLPAVILLSKFIILISGVKEKVVFRDTQGVPFLLIQRGSRFDPRRPAFVCLNVILASASVAIGALWLRNIACVILLFASMAHYIVSRAISARPITVKGLIISGLCMLAMLVIFSYQLYWMPSDRNDTKMLKLFQSHNAGDVNWAGMILGSLVCNLAFQYIAMCYRMDHAFARPDELLVGEPDVKLSPRGSNNNEEDSLIDAYGTRISYRRRGSRLRWPKPYFHVSLLAWLASIALIALAKVQGYIECNAEVANVYALYVAPSLISIGILICALARGELGKVWRYKEDWVAAPKSETTDGAEVVVAQAKAEEVLIDIDEKTLPA